MNKKTKKASVAKIKVKKVIRDRKREEDIRLSFHNGMLAGLEAVKREVGSKEVAPIIAKIANRIIAHRDERTHKYSRWYTGSCRVATKRAERKVSAK